ncbi:MAG: GNAT family N-acetyltransferase [Anaerolineae bacterium]|nr:GNAT family N-acetyltransferase [Anaerolineae bacterium]
MQNESLNLLDNLAHHLIKASEGIRLAVADSQEQREAIFRLRYRTVIEHGWAKPEDLPEGIEHDTYDNDAIHIGGWIGEQLAVTMRLVLPSPERLLPTEAAFGMRVEPVGQVVDYSRGIVSPEFRKQGQPLFFGALGLLWLQSRSRGYHEICGTAAAWMMEYYKRSGFLVIPLGTPQLYWGELRYPIKFDLTATLNLLRM